MVSGGILKSGTIITIRECNTEKVLAGMYISGKNYLKKLLERAEFLQRVR